MIYKIQPKNSINEALKVLKDGDTLYLEAGIYNEKVEVYNNNITIIGEDKNTTIISNGDYYHKIMSDYNECNTFRTYTVFIGGNNVTLKNITVENTRCSSIYGQAVALHVIGNKFYANNAIIKSEQDTLYLGPLQDDLRERYKNFLNPLHLHNLESIQVYDSCNIIGDVDFIFGKGKGLFINSNIISKGKGYLAAPSHAEDDKFGFLFYKCNLIKETTETSFLARPWRDYGTCAFIKCNMDSHIDQKGFDKWQGTNRDKTARFFEYTENIDLSKREPWVNILNEAQANEYVNKYLDYIKYDIEKHEYI